MRADSSIKSADEALFKRSQPAFASPIASVQICSPSQPETADACQAMRLHKAPEGGSPLPLFPVILITFQTSLFIRAKDCIDRYRVSHAAPESARGLAHSKTLREVWGHRFARQRLGVRRPSTAFSCNTNNFSNFSSHPRKGLT